MIVNIQKEREVFLFCDFHGHSRKRNSFMYGNLYAANGGFLSWTKIWLLPWILARWCEMFNYKGCWFKVEKNKLGTSWVVCWDQLKITNSFTLENSFYGYKYGEARNTIAYTPSKLEEIGMSLGYSLIELY